MSIIRLLGGVYEYNPVTREITPKPPLIEKPPKPNWAVGQKFQKTPKPNWEFDFEKFQKPPMNCAVGENFQKPPKSIGP